MAATIMFSINANALLCFFFTTPTRFDMLKYGLIFLLYYQYFNTDFCPLFTKLVSKTGAEILIL